MDSGICRVCATSPSSTERDMKSLRKARESGKLDQFAADREFDPPGDEAAFNATLQSMAGKSKAVPEASSPDVPGD